MANFGLGRDLDQRSSHHLDQHKLAKKATIPPGLDDYAYNLTSVSSRSALAKREDKHWYEKYEEKGRQALCMIMQNPLSNRVFTRQDQVNAWEVVEEEGYVSPNLVPALQALYIPHSPEDAKSVTAFQTMQITGPDGQIYPPTNGEYNNLFIPAGQRSRIIAKNNNSPTKQGMPGQPVPTLNRWSDVVWMNWTAIAGNQARQLRFVIRENIITPETRKLIEYIEVAKPDDLNLPWTGNVYNMHSEYTRALLGSVHGMGVAYLIIDHSNVLGRKIPAIRVFSAPSAENPAFRQYKWLYYLIFELRNTIDGPD
ncbi:MAG: hypothetical protein Q9225_001174 [Loekoesia sp. 1 TL-2023]